MQNALHYAALNDNIDFVEFIIEQDSKKNTLRGERNLRNKRQVDLDLAKRCKERLSVLGEHTKNKILDRIKKLHSKGKAT